MVPKIIKGHSISGCAKYMLYGSDGKDFDRVLFTETRNLATHNPDIAWRAMVATATDQERLKDQAGVSNTGRKSKMHALHLVLSFHPDEAKELDKTKMLAAADGAIKSLGAGGKQALIVCHDDTKHPHLHILINRVDPVNGKMLSTSNDRLKLSKWAQKWEQTHGVYCEQRIINNAARRDEYIRCKDTAQHIVQAAGRPINDNEKDAAVVQLRDQDKAKSAKIAREQTAMLAGQAKKWAKMQRSYKQRKQAIKDDVAKKIAAAKKPIKQAWRKRRSELYHQAKAELASFKKNEKSWLGRWANRFNTVDIMAAIRGDSGGGGKKVQAITKSFTAMVSPAARLQNKLNHIASQEDAIRGKQKSQEQAAARGILSSADTRARYGELRVAYQVERSELTLECSAEDARYRARWKKRTEDRRKEWEPVRSQEQEKKARKRRTRKPRKPRTRSTTKASDLLPKEGAAERAGQIDAHKTRSERRARRKRNKRERGKEDYRGR